VLLAAGAAHGYGVAALDARGPADATLLAELDAAVLVALADHEVTDAAEVTSALEDLGIETVETQKDADRLGAKLGVSFVVAPHITPLAGQSRIEILVYFLPDGRAEMLEQIAIEGELEEVVASMIWKLVTKEGLLGSEPEPAPQEEPAEQEPTTDEELLEELEPAQPEEPEPEPRRGFGDPFRVSAALVGGWTLLLNEPAVRGARFRQGGHIGASIGYVVVPKVGLEVGGDIHVMLGPSGYGFGLAPALSFHLPVHRIVFLGARLGIGFYKGATGSQRSSMLVRAAMLTELLVHERVFIRFELPAFTLLAFGDKAVPAAGFLELNAGIGFRF
jgi:hypothetical protein